MHLSDLRPQDRTKTSWYEDKQIVKGMTIEINMLIYVYILLTFESDK